MQPRVGLNRQHRGKGKGFRPGIRDYRVRAERVAGHTGSLTVAIMALRFLTHFAHINVARALELTIVHDMFAEWRDGDTCGYHIETDPARRAEIKAEKEHRERLAAYDACVDLPHHLGRHFIHLYEEYTRGETPEADFVKQVDKLDFALTCLYYVLKGDPLPLKEEILPCVRAALTDPWLLGVVDEIERRC